MLSISYTWFLVLAALLLLFRLPRRGVHGFLRSIVYHAAPLASLGWPKECNDEIEAIDHEDFGLVSLFDPADAFVE
jgi:hypothetical protein